MKLDAKQKKQLEETKYLSTDNTWRYRTITRIMYKCYEKMKYILYKEDIMIQLKEFEDFENYSMDNLKADLDALTTWKNLLATSDSSKVKSIDEFKNKEFRYQLSPYTIEIERMLINLENMTVENNASLEASMVERFKNDLSETATIFTKENKEIYNWWKKLNSDFRELNQNYQDYISRFYSPKTEEMIKTTEFLLYKEGFINYLRDFIRGLQTNSLMIKEILKAISDDVINKIIDASYQYERSISAQEIKEEEYKDVNLGRFLSMKEWFISYNNRAPLIEQLIDNTNEIIRKITRFAAQIADKRGASSNRKEEYRKLAALFDKCSNIEEAHKLSSLVFGVFGMKHIKANPLRATESINSSIYEEEPSRIILKPRVRNYREKLTRRPIADKSELKLKKLTSILQSRKREEEIIMRLVSNNQVDFNKLPTISSADRNVLLRWLSRAKGIKGGNVKTEYGKGYRIVESEEGGSVRVECED
ncbi:MAG: TIGR02677 family protein, partial [Clostridiales bacterium GWB2_37_7]